MNQLTFIKLATVVFLLLGIIHIYRGISGVPLTLNDWQAPIFVSYLEGLVFLLLGITGYLSWKKSA